MFCWNIFSTGEIWEITTTLLDCGKQDGFNKLSCSLYGSIDFCGKRNELFDFISEWHQILYRTTLYCVRLNQSSCLCFLSYTAYLRQQWHIKYNRCCASRESRNVKTYILMTIASIGTETKCFFRSILS